MTKIARRIVGVPILWIGAFFLIFGAVIAYGLLDTKKTVDDFRRRTREDG